MPQDQGMQDSKHLFPVDVLVLMPGGNPGREYLAVVNATNAFESTGISVNPENMTGELNKEDRGPG